MGGFLHVIRRVSIACIIFPAVECELVLTNLEFFYLPNGQIVSDMSMEDTYMQYFWGLCGSWPFPKSRCGSSAAARNRETVTVQRCVNVQFGESVLFSLPFHGVRLPLMVRLWA
jgi:hypothetical protein